MSRWKNFLDSLDTPGGVIFILVFGVVFSAVLAVGVAVLLPQKEKVYDTATGLMTGFSAALFMAIQRKTSTSVDVSGRNAEVNVTNPPADPKIAEPKPEEPKKEI